MSRPIDVGILGATGTVGQQIAASLAHHPWFRLTWVGSSERSAGRCYGDLPWRLPVSIAESASRLTVEPLVPGRAPQILLSALSASVAGEVEEAFARAGHVVISNARNHRMDPLVPLLVPEINPEHLELIPLQQEARSWPGAIVTNPNCSTVFLAIALAALRQFRPNRVAVTTLQALSGAGYPGVASLDAVGNVIPFIDGEEEKIETETRKILGTLDGGRVEPAPVTISAQTTRVPVVNGHMELIALSFDEPVSRDDLLHAFSSFSGRPQALRLPSAPVHPIVYLDHSDRPQPRLDVDCGGGMSVAIGRLRPCPIFGYKFVALGHNTVRGAAGAAILNAELMAAEGWLERRAARSRATVATADVVPTRQP